MINYRDFPKPFSVQNSQKNDIKKSGFYNDYLTRDFHQSPDVFDIWLCWYFFENFYSKWWNY